MNNNIFIFQKNEYTDLLKLETVATKMLDPSVSWSHGCKTDYNSYKAPKYQSYRLCEILGSAGKSLFFVTFSVIYHLGQTLIFGVYKGVTFQGWNYLRAKTFCVIRDLEQAVGYAAIVTCFCRKWGYFHVQQAQFQKKYYDNYLEVEPIVKQIKEACQADGFVFDIDELKDIEDPLKSALIQHATELANKQNGKVISNQKVIQETHEEINEFKKAALKTFSEKKHDEVVPECELNQEQKTQLDSLEGLYYEPNENVKVIRGGGNYVLFLKTVPNWVFKPMDNKEEGEKYIKISEDARKVVQEKNLYMLHVPVSKLIEINGKFFVAQEKAGLIATNYSNQEGIYNYCWHDEEMGTYTETIFEQLLLFIYLTKFSDVKYDNIPICKNGKIALIDLDQGSIISGLTRGGGQKDHNGLLNYLPLDKIEKFMGLAKENLSTTDFEKLKEKIEAIRERAQKKMEKEKEQLKFLHEISISSAVKRIKTDHVPTQNNKEKKLILMLTKRINKELIDGKNYSSLVGRKVHLHCSLGGELIDDVKRILGVDKWAAMSRLVNILDKLKKENCIYKYRINTDTDDIKISC